MTVSRSRHNLHPLAALSLTLTGLAALVGGLILIGIGVAEWLDPRGVFGRPSFIVGWRPFSLMPLAIVPCLVGAAGLLLPGARLVGGGGRRAIIAVVVNLDRGARVSPLYWRHHALGRSVWQRIGRGR